MERKSEKVVFDTIHSLCLIIKGLDADRTRLQKQTHDLIDKFEEQYAEMFEKQHEK